MNTYLIPLTANENMPYPSHSQWKHTFFLSQPMIMFVLLTANDNVSKLNAMLTIPQKLPGSANSTRWQLKLEAAQNIIFCKELFSQVNAPCLFNNEYNRKIVWPADDIDAFFSGNNLLLFMLCRDYCIYIVLQ